MNLIKLFNFKYFKENLKKSKGLVAILLSVVPIFTTLFTVLVINGKNEVSFPGMEILIMINTMGMYFIPVLLSLVLFGYVYKKKSVDFINSQPINRKTIFVTNTVGGILLMGVIQAITAIILLICGSVLPNLVIFPEMILDIFLIMWLSYSFTFVATNIAMSVSGTFCTQIVLTMLILFLLPFCMDCYKEFSNGINFELINGEKTFNQYANVDEYYTMPYEMFHMIFSNTTSEFSLCSGKIISRMIILGLVYYFIGLHLFKNRKMENNEESFYNEKVHIIVKALTILPMILLLNIAEAGKEFNIIAIAIIITYYFVYDFCVKRKIKLKSSIIYLVLTLVALQGICSGLEKIKEAMPIAKLNINNIASVKFLSTNEEIINQHYISRVTEMGGFVENEEIIKLLLDSAYETYYFKDRNMEKAEVIDSEIPEENYKENDKKTYCDVAIKTKDGKIYGMSVTILQEDLDKIIEKLSEDEKFVAKIKKSINNDGILTIGNAHILKNEEKDIVLSEIETKINEMSLKEIRNMDKYAGSANIIRYYYKNHKLIGVSVNDSTTPKTLEIVANYMNQAVISKLKNSDGKRYGYKVYFNKENGLRDWIYLDYIGEEVKSFILENENETFDPNKPYYSIIIDTRIGLQFYTNKTEEVEEFIKRAVQYEEELKYDNKIDDVIDPSYMQ